MHSLHRFVIPALTLLLAAAPAALAETADESRLRQLAGQAASYASEVRALLAKGASPNQPGQGGRTALHGAAGIGAAETMQALLEAGGKPNVRDEDGNTPLHFAADGSSPLVSIGGAVATRANQSSKRLGGKLTFALAAALTVRWFPGNTVTLHLDGKALRAAKITHVAVGNGQYHGGGMWVCPRAVLDDGLLDVTVIRHLSALQILRASPALYNGRLYEHPSVEYYRASRVDAFSSDRSLIEIDGEPAGRLPLEISVLPKAMAVYVPGDENLQSGT